MAKTNTTNQVTSNLMSMKDAIVYMHENNNDHAISMDDCDELGISEQDFHQWVAYVEMLRQVVIPYVEKSQDKDATEKQIQNAANKVYAAWKDVLSDAMGPKFSKNWFVRSSDTAWLLRCAARNVNTRSGSAYGFKTKGMFRREVERLIGCRMASNAILSSKDSDTIVKYESACARITYNNDLLNKGNIKKAELPLFTQKEQAESALEKRREFLLQDKRFADDPDLLEVGLTLEQNKLNDIEQRIKNARKAIRTATETKNDLEEDYKKIMSNVKAIEEDGE